MEIEVNRLGNLILLPPGINGKAGYKSFREKKKIYQMDNNLLQVGEILEETSWNGKRFGKEKKECFLGLKRTGDK